MPGTDVSASPQPSRRWVGFPFAGFDLSRLIGAGIADQSVIPAPLPGSLPVVGGANKGFGSSGQITMTVGGSMRPADHPKAVHPHRGQKVVAAVQVPDETELVVARHLVDVLQATAGVLSGGNPDGLVRPFVLPNSTQSAQLLTGLLAKRLLGGEQRPDVVIGHGTIGGIFAANITQGLLEGRCEAEFLPVERNFRTNAEGYNFLCTASEIRTILQGRRIILAIPILSDQHYAEVLAVKHLVDMEKCAAQLVGIVTLIQYGALPPTMAELRVEALLTVGR